MYIPVTQQQYDNHVLLQKVFDKLIDAGQLGEIEMWSPTAVAAYNSVMISGEML